MGNTHWVLIIISYYNHQFSEETRAWGAQVAEETYEKKGEIITVDDLDMYVVGDGPNGKTPSGKL